MEDWSDFVRESIVARNDIVFTKKENIFLESRNKASIKEMEQELRDPVYLVFAYKQVIHYQGRNEERFRCYFVYSNTKGRCYILRFNHQVKVITVFPLGRKTLVKYKKRFK